MTRLFGGSATWSADWEGENMEEMPFESGSNVQYIDRPLGFPRVNVHTKSIWGSSRQKMARWEKSKQGGTSCNFTCPHIEQDAECGCITKAVHLYMRRASDQLHVTKQQSSAP
jgi:hypothetical protein